MEMIERITLSLDDNQHLTDEIKRDFLELIVIFNKKFPEVELDTFVERIKTLKIEKGNKFIVKTSWNYDVKNNIIYLNSEEFAKEDGRHELMIIILQMITAKDDYYGFNKDNEFEVISIGLTEMIADYLVGNERDDNE